MKFKKNILWGGAILLATVPFAIEAFSFFTNSEEPFCRAPHAHSDGSLFPIYINGLQNNGCDSEIICNALWSLIKNTIEHACSGYIYGSDSYHQNDVHVSYGAVTNSGLNQFAIFTSVDAECIHPETEIKLEL